MADQAEKPESKKFLLYVGGFLLSFALTFGATYWYIVIFKHPQSASEVLTEQSEETFRDSGDTQHPSAVAAPDSGGAFDPLSQDSTAGADKGRPLERTESWEAERVKPSETPVEEDVVEQKSRDEGRVRQLTKIYGAMRAEKAARIIATLNDTTIIEILVKMRERQAAKILAAMEPDRAAQISRKMTAFR